MRIRLALVIALAVLGTVIAASAAQGDGVVGSGQSGVSINLPQGEDLPNVAGGVLPACSNLSDDDGDGAADMGDPGCSGPLDGDESNPAPTTTTTPTTTTPSTTTTTPQPQPEPNPSGPINGHIGPEGSGAPSSGAVGSDESASGGTGGTGGTSGSNGGGNEDESGSDNGGVPPPPPPRQPDGTPTRSNPSVSITDFGPAPLGVPNFMIESFEIPPFLLPIYQACGTQYGIPWQVLAAINKIETAFGTNLNVSTAGAEGWMQFIPSTWQGYGVDANGDGKKDPYNPVDAICAAARYLRAAGGDHDLRTAIFAYNHADWYVDEVLSYANQYAKLPEDLVGSLTGLTEGAHFPIAGPARYADDINERVAARRASTGGGSGNVADVIGPSAARRGINIYSREGAPVVAVNDGVIKKIGHDPKLGNYIVLQDTYGNRFTYARLGSVAKVYPVPDQQLTAHDFDASTPHADDQTPNGSATGGGETRPGQGADSSQGGGSDQGGSSQGSPESNDSQASADGASSDGGVVNTEDSRDRVYALPERSHNVEDASLSGQLDSVLADHLPGYETVKSYFGDVLHFDSATMNLRPLTEGAQVTAGTVLGRVGRTDSLAPHINFSIRPVGRGAPKIDPKPILDGWKLLESTAIYRATGQNPFTFDEGATVSQILLMSKTQLERRVLADPRVSMYDCGRTDIQTHQIDRRVLAVLEYLAESGFRLYISALKCGHSVYTTSGTISAHSWGGAVDIAMVNGIPIADHQGPGSITEAVIQQLMQLQGPMRPAQIISLMDLGGPSFAMSDHWDHIHVGYTQTGTGEGPTAVDTGNQPPVSEMLKPDQWLKLINRIAHIDNPQVPTEPSDAALPAGGTTSGGGNRGD